MEKWNLTQVTKDFGYSKYRFYFYKDDIKMTGQESYGPYIESPVLSRFRPGLHDEYYVTIFKVIV